MSTVLEKPILLDETGQDIVDALIEIKNAINSGVPEGDPVRITIVTPPTKTQYEYDETLDLSGISVSAVFSNNYMFDITNQCTFTPGNGSHFSGIGDVPVTVSWTWHGTGQVFTTTQMVEVALDIVTWENGTDAQIAKMLDAHYAGVIDIHDYWSVGDERVVNLPEIRQEVSSSSIWANAQAVKMVLLNEGGKELVNPINGVTECAFIVGQKNPLVRVTDSTSATILVQRMNESNDDLSAWRTCGRRTWCNESYYNAIPSGIRGLFKLHKNIQSSVPSATQPSVVVTADVTEDYFALLSEKEVFGEVTYSNADVEANNTHFEYYQNSSNINKNFLEDYSGIGYGAYWLRSTDTRYAGNVRNFCAVECAQTTGASHGARVGNNDAASVCPFGVI